VKRKTLHQKLTEQLKQALETPIDHSIYDPDGNRQKWIDYTLQKYGDGQPNKWREEWMKPSMRENKPTDTYFDECTCSYGSQCDRCRNFLDALNQGQYPNVNVTSQNGKVISVTDIHTDGGVFADKPDVAGRTDAVCLCEIGGPVCDYCEKHSDWCSEPVKTPVQTETCVEEAIRIVNGQRREDYGSAEDSTQAIADAWSAYLGIEVSKRDFCWMMVLLKAFRDKGGNPKRDNVVDGHGYLLLLEKAYGNGPTTTG
jgi:hypothetical protein